MAKSLDRRKNHLVFGHGPGRDVYVQDGHLFDSAGRLLPMDERAIESDHGITVHPDLRVWLAGNKARQRAEVMESRIRASVARAEKIERARIISETEGISLVDAARSIGLVLEPGEFDSAPDETPVELEEVEVELAEEVEEPPVVAQPIKRTRGRSK